jgi:Fic-DOC domain mobile mystery protein B
MTDLFDTDDDQTELSAQERKGLKPAYVTYRSELNREEQENILKAEKWLFARRLIASGFTDQGFIRQVHKKMYGDVWEWAGKYRQSDRNIGVDYYRIPMEMRMFVDDVRYWLEHGTYAVDELAVRFHHRLVWIHPFPNGNGRLSRLLADRLAVSLGESRFTWGSAHLVKAGEMRARYVDALRAADAHDLRPLLDFARS